MHFNEGDCVRVRQDLDYPPGPWPTEPIGRITYRDAETPYRAVQTPKGVRRMWLVTFDEPQYDADGDGPYASSEILEKYLNTIA
jgi:hypothetical protein